MRYLWTVIFSDQQDGDFKPIYYCSSESDAIICMKNYGKSGYYRIAKIAKTGLYWHHNHADVTKKIYMFKGVKHEGI